jgi:type VI secretion system protein ImpJ
MKYQQAPFWPIEGALLSQHSFQHDALVTIQKDSKKATIFPNHYGVVRLEIDENALSENILRINHLSIIFQNGTWILGHQNAEIKDKSFKHLLNEDVTKISVFVCIKRIHPDQQCIQVPEYDQPKKEMVFTPKEIIKIDSNTGKNEKRLDIMLWNVMIFFDKPSPDNYESIKIAQMIISPHSEIPVLDPDFIPPLLNVRASLSLKNRFHKLINHLHKHSQNLKNQLMEKKSMLTADPFFVLNDHLMSAAILNTVWVLDFLITTKNSHPQQLYIELLRLTGNLSSIFPQISVSIPPYDHGNLSMIFKNLISQLSELLRSGFISEYISVDFVKDEDIMSCMIDPSLFSQDAVFYLCIDSEKSDDEMDKIFNINKIKIGPKSKLPELVKYRKAGFVWERVRRPPQGMQDRNGLHYYRLNIIQDSELWQTLITEYELGIYGLSDNAMMQIKFFAHIKRKGGEYEA